MAYGEIDRLAIMAPAETIQSIAFWILSVNCKVVEIQTPVLMRLNGVDSLTSMNCQFATTFNRKLGLQLNFGDTSSLASLRT